MSPADNVATFPDIETLRAAPETVRAPAAKPRRALPLRAMIAVAVAAVVGAGGVGWIVSAKGAETTDNAYVQADKSVVAPKVRGLVAQVLVRDNQLVRAGDPLIRLDPEEYDARVAAAAADLQSAHAAVDAAQAALVSLSAEEQLAASAVREAQSAIRSADAQRQRAIADRDRYDRLMASGFGAGKNADQYRASAVSADADAARSRAAFDVSRDQAAVTSSRRASLLAALEQARAVEAKARAALDLARQDQVNSVIRAPIAGIVGARQAQPGDYVQPGSRLMTLVPTAGLYVTANFKETQTARMTAGDKAEVRVDALPGVTLKGRVDSFAPGSGSDFALLPFEPGTGNFTKIVQRVPVRIRLDPGQRVDRLRSGLSATVKVRLAALGAAAALTPSAVRPRAPGGRAG
jgi:membrane fusion protein (multidrug efflux system)